MLMAWSKRHRSTRGKSGATTRARRRGKHANYYTTQTYHAKKTGFTEGKDFVPRTDALLTYVTSKADITFDSDYYNAELSRWTDDHARDHWNIETRIVIPGRRDWLVRWAPSTPMPWSSCTKSCGSGSQRRSRQQVCSPPAVASRDALLRIRRRGFPGNARETPLVQSGRSWCYSPAR